MTTARATAFDPDALRAWLAERDLRPTTFAAAIGHDRATVHRWLNGTREPEIPIALIQRGLALGAQGRVWPPERLQRWMGRQAYGSAVGLAADLGMDPTTVRRWLGNAKPYNPAPYWLPLALAALEGDVAARRERRKRERRQNARIPEQRAS